jgi:hypothetical protein
LNQAKKWALKAQKQPAQSVTLAERQFLAAQPAP